ncbi:helix-hairpin-helix domain-containing protein [Acidithiobacillus montserratensis]|uniref:Helix-hairpin-helix domain-containing protein n=1 Tax=Acidithiobacillus montserratensis TaxID=2729135 RepID=A0ACD5HI62_9PROT|nr:helix-hairpin-helix domain-containing protein [Acidithiobacillus montserratensis]MBN2679501.1 helix-hairpin-helix domain-containing protein [Acidithiobacillaceae bacterium]MBU2747361.1 helix-hairpin-helix domain-containing protein [Acidithiobacillus montserratensis]
MLRDAVLLVLMLLLSCHPAWAKGKNCPAQVNINQAGVEQLRCLKGVGKKRAAAIVVFREAHGPFPGPAALGAVLSPKIVARLRPQIITQSAD